MKKSLLWIAVAGLTSAPLAGPALADEVRNQDSRNCIPTRRLKNTAVIDDKNILFVMLGKTFYHNVLPRQCTGLAREGRFTYGTLAGNLCRHDTIRVLFAGSDMGGRTCSLGHFYKVEEEDLRALVEGFRGPITTQAPPAADVEEIGADAEDAAVEKEQ